MAWPSVVLPTDMCIIACAGFREELNTVNKPLGQLPSASQASQLSKFCFPAHESFPASGCNPLQGPSQCWPLGVIPNTL